MVTPVARASSPISESDLPVSSCRTLQQSYESTILAISQLNAGYEQEKESLIKECVEMAVNALPHFNFIPLKESKAAFEKHLSDFENVVDNNFQLFQEDRTVIKLAVNAACFESSKKQWMASAVQDFYSLFLLPTIEERVDTAQNWTHQLLKGATYFNLTEDNGMWSRIECLPQSEAEKVVEIFESHYTRMMEEQEKVMVRLAEEDKPLFDEKTMNLLRRAKEDFYSLSREDKQMLEAAIDILKDEKRGRPFLTRKERALVSCIREANYLQQNLFSINSPDSKQGFLGIMATFDHQIVEYFSALRFEEPEQNTSKEEKNHVDV